MTTPKPEATMPAIAEALAEEPTEAEIAEMRAEAEAFRLPAPPPIPVRGRYYLTECPNCGWTGSSEQCGSDAVGDDSDVYCPVCCQPDCEDAPNEADTFAHGEAAYQRIVVAEAERDALAAMAGRGFVELLRDLALALGRKDVWIGLHSGSSIIIRQLEAELAAATARATEAEARASAMEAVLNDPVAVHLNMLRHTIARPSLANIIHLYGAADLRAALSPADPSQSAEGAEKGGAGHGR